MRILLFAILLFLSCATSQQQLISLDEPKTSLAPCPASPNCISTTASKKSKRMKPLTFNSNASIAILRLDSIVQSFDRVILINQSDQYLHYTFRTKLGGFTDDVEFLVDVAAKVIHFRSASRKGWSDAGANRRRMRRIIAAWENRD